MSKPEDYTVGWICAVNVEYVAAQEFLEVEHEVSEYVSQHDNNHYTLGRIGEHNIVIASLPYGEYGLTSAATVARDMLHSFPNVRVGLMVGIAGGAPSLKHDIRLGDIVVGTPGGGEGGILQYDFGKSIQGEAFHETGFLNQPPTILRAAVSGLMSRYERKGHKIEEAIQGIINYNARLRKKYSRPDPKSDRLFQSTIIHPPDKEGSCAEVCVSDELVVRCERGDDEDNPAIHYGLIASANKLMKDATIRDKLAKDRGVLCFEMEAAGLMNHFPCLIIRGICDYADSHKNKEWQGYAAMAAAAYAKDLLYSIRPTKIEAEKKISDLLSNIGQDIHDTKIIATKTSGDVRQIISEKQHLDIHKWLSPPDPSTNYNRALQLRHKETGAWFLQSAIYSSWRSTPNSFLWLNGKPGCGKTILSSTIIQDEQKTNSQSNILLYFYFDFSDSTKQSLEYMVRSLIYQLYCHTSAVQNCLRSVYSASSNGEQQPSTEVLCTTFQDMLDLAGEVRIILDALDECPMHQGPCGPELLTWIKGLRCAKKDIRLIVTSRPEQYIESKIKNLAQEKDIISLQGRQVDMDIHQYIQDRVCNYEGLSRWEEHPEIQEEIQSALIEKADGMFRWVTCQLDALEACLDYPALQRALKALPRTLDETYSRILNSIDPDYLPYTKRLLQFLTFSELPLRIEEAVDAIAVDLTARPRFNSRNRMPVPAEISRYCSGLVVVTKIKRHVFAQPVMAIQLSHFSVKEWLVSGRLATNLSADFNPSAAHASIAIVCLAYLLELNKHTEWSHIIEAYPFAKFSAASWAKHLARTKDASEAVTSMAVELLSNQVILMESVKLSSNPWKKSREPLSFAAEEGLFQCTQQLLEQGAHFYGSDVLDAALQRASRGGHKAIVELLLQKGANPNDAHHGQELALQYACAEGHVDVAQVLLENGADVNAPGGEFRGTALQAASEEGHKAVVELLLQKGADLNAPGDKFHTTALQAASRGGHKAVVELLLQKDADVNAPGSDFHGTALQAASSQGHKAVVELLLQKGADLNAPGGKFYKTALQAASKGGNKAVVELLLQKGADVNAPGGDFIGTALQAASTGGHKAVVELLLEKGADVNAPAVGYRGTALKIAPGQGHKRVVELLLEWGAKTVSSSLVFQH